MTNVGQVTTLADAISKIKDYEMWPSTFNNVCMLMGNVGMRASYVQQRELFRWRDNIIVGSY